MKRLIVLAALFATPLFAQETPQQVLASAGVGDALWQAGRAALVYAQEHGEVGAGYFVITGHGRGVGTAQSLYPSWATFTPWDAYELRLGIAHASVPTPERSWELAMLTASVKILEVPKLNVLNDVVVARTLRLHFGGLRGGVFVGTPVDQVALAVGAQLQFAFGN